jgi:hypothetical protein
MLQNEFDLCIKGSLAKMPSIISSSSCEKIIKISRRSIYNNNLEQYDIILSLEDADHIENYGHFGMLIEIYGRLREGQKTEIIAEKIIFISFPTSPVGVSHEQIMKSTNQFYRTCGNRLNTH